MAVFFEPININDWNMFEKVKHVGHIEPVLAVNTMNLGDVVLLYVGKQNADIKSGVYAYGIIVKTPYIYKANPADQCYGKNAVDIRIDRIVYRTPLIDADDFKKYVNQYRTPHMIETSHYLELLERVGYKYIPAKDEALAATIDEEKVSFAISVLLRAIAVHPLQKEKEIRFDNGFFGKTEAYKYRVYESANRVLGVNDWKESMIGSGEISARVLKVFQKQDNLVYFATNAFKDKINADIRKADRIFYDIYCGNDDEQAFRAFTQQFGFVYDRTAYLFFLKNREEYLPIRSTHFAARFKWMGIESDCTSGLSWEHYREYIKIIKAIQSRIQPYFKEKVTLLDAHSFTWAMYAVKDQLLLGNVEYLDYAGGIIDLEKADWIELLKDREIFQPSDNELLEKFYLSPNHASTCKALSIEEKTHPSAYILPVVRLSKRIMGKLEKDPIRRNNEEYMWWPVLFLGRELPSGLFEWKIRPELVAAMEELYAYELAYKVDEADAVQSSDEELYRKAVEHSSDKAKSRLTIIERRERDPRISELAKRIARGVCQLCENEAPFEDRNGNPYLESHHIVWLSQDGADSLENVIALCPNCHRKMHIVNDQEDKALLLDCARDYARLLKEKYEGEI